MRRGTTREPRRGLPARFDRTEPGGLCAETPAARRGLRHLFVSLLPSRAEPQREAAGIRDVAYKKKRKKKQVTEGCRVQDYDLLIGAPLNSSLTASGERGRVLRGMIGKHKSGSHPPTASLTRGYSNVRAAKQEQRRPLKLKGLLRWTVTRQQGGGLQGPLPVNSRL